MKGKKTKMKLVGSWQTFNFVRLRSTENSIYVKSISESPLRTEQESNYTRVYRMF